MATTTPTMHTTDLSRPPRRQPGLPHQRPQPTTMLDGARSRPGAKPTHDLLVLCPCPDLSPEYFARHLADAAG